MQYHSASIAKKGLAQPHIPYRPAPYRVNSRQRATARPLVTFSNRESRFSVISTVLTANPLLCSQTRSGFGRFCARIEQGSQTRKALSCQLSRVNRLDKPCCTRLIQRQADWNPVSAERIEHVCQPTGAGWGQIRSDQFDRRNCQIRPQLHPWSPERRGQRRGRAYKRSVGRRGCHTFLTPIAKIGNGRGDRGQMATCYVGCLTQPGPGLESAVPDGVVLDVLLFGRLRDSNISF